MNQDKQTIDSNTRWNYFVVYQLHGRTYNDVFTLKNIIISYEQIGMLRDFILSKAMEKFPNKYSKFLTKKIPLAHDNIPIITNFILLEQIQIDDTVKEETSGE